MNKKASILSVIFLFTAYLSFSQGAFQFMSDKHDFGVIEEGTQAAYEFEFTNVGNAPIVLSDVRASCGCTTPSWTKEPIAPGGKGSIKASYNSEGRPGTFNKSITITSNAVESSKVVYIKGVVEGKKEKTVPTAAELKTSPKITFDKNSHNFGKVERGQKVTAKFKIKNTGKSPLTIASSLAACNCITYKLEKDESIPAGKSAVVEVTYAPAYDGKNMDIITFLSNDLSSPKTAVTLTADVVESLSIKSPVIQEKSTVPFK